MMRARMRARAHCCGARGGMRAELMALEQEAE